LLSGVAPAVTASAATPKLELLPKIGLADEPVQVRLTGLARQQKVAVTASLRDDLGALWVAQAQFRASADGKIDNRTDVPISGSYSGVDVTGLVWSMMSQTAADAQQAIHFADPLAAMTINVWVKLVASDAESSRHDPVLLEGSVTRLPIAPGVTHTQVREGGIVGELFLPAGPGPFPGIVAVGGSGGGLNPLGKARSALLASRGYAVLSLAYFKYEGVPRSLVRIPLEYFDRALTWLGEQSSVDRDRLGFMGASRGGELTLLVASYLPIIKTAVALVPSHVIWGNPPDEFLPGGTEPSWTFKGKPLPYMLPEEWKQTQRTSRDELPGLPQIFLHYVNKYPDQARQAAIPVERSRAPILLVSGGADEIWPSRTFSDAVVARMQRAGKGKQVRHLTYDHAGHSPLRAPILPTTVVSPNAARAGVTAQGNAKAQAEAWPEVLRFLGETLASRK
jgi:dienelactone hydrolase